MPFVKGQSGNPNGRNLERIASHELKTVLGQIITKGRHKGKSKLKRVCEVIAAQALQGEPWAAQLVFDRLEGKAMQAIDTTITHEASALFVELLRGLNDVRNGRTIEHIAVGDQENRPLLKSSRPETITQ